MAMLTIRSIEEELKHRLRVRAARAGRSMEEEARCILRDALADGDEPDGLGSRVHARVMALTGGVDLAVPPRSAPRPAPPRAGPGRWGTMIRLDTTWCPSG